MQANRPITTDEDFIEAVQKPGVLVFDVYSGWAGFCEPMQPTLKKLRTEFGEGLFAHHRVLSDQVSMLARFRNKSCPLFLIYAGGVLTHEVKGANSPLLEKYVREDVAIAKSGGTHVPVSGSPVEL